MKARLLQAWVALRESYWFLPAVCSLVAVALAVVAIVIDRTWGPWSIEAIPPIRPDGARAVLSTAAGSLITVAGVAISVTLVALASVSSQFGPRLLVLFLRDRGIQLALGLFSASFLCCLVVLLFVRSAGEAGAPFVPQLGLALAFLASVMSVGTFIYLVHHVAQMLQVDNVVARSGSALLRGVASLQGRDAGGTALEPEDVDADPALEGEPGALLADRDGYLQVMDLDTLLQVTASLQRHVAVQVRAGEFLTEGLPIVRFWPARPLTREEEGSLRSGFAWGVRRTNDQDVRFQVDQLVQIAARALSPGVNDPFTAMSCMDWLEAALRRASHLPPATWIRHRLGDRASLTYPVTTHQELMDAAVGQLMPYAATDPNAARHLAAILRRQGIHATSEAHRSAVAASLERLQHTVDRA